MRSVLVPSISDIQAHIAESYRLVSALYGPFKSKAKEQVCQLWLGYVGVAS